MRRDTCLFCPSRRCYTRITAPGYDEIACSRHIRELELDADRRVEGEKLHASYSSPVRRGSRP